MKSCFGSQIPLYWHFFSKLLLSEYFFGGKGKGNGSLGVRLDACLVYEYDISWETRRTLHSGTGLVLDRKRWGRRATLFFPVLQFHVLVLAGFRPSLYNYSHLSNCSFLQAFGESTHSHSSTSERNFYTLLRHRKNQPFFTYPLPSVPSHAAA